MASKVVPWKDVGPNDDMDDDSYQVGLLLNVRVQHDHHDGNPREPVWPVPLLTIVQTSQGIPGHKEEVDDEENGATDLKRKQLLFVILQLLSL